MRTSNDIMCDQFHEGTGFLTHHLALTNSFEVSQYNTPLINAMQYLPLTIYLRHVTLRTLSIHTNVPPLTLLILPSPLIY